MWTNFLVYGHMDLTLKKCVFYVHLPMLFGCILKAGAWPDLAPLKDVCHIHLTLKDCRQWFGRNLRAGAWPDSASMASIEWIRMVPH